MTISNETTSITLPGDGSSTAFDWNFLIPYQADGSTPAIKVTTLVSAVVTVLVLGVDYTVAGIDVPAGGTVTYPDGGSLTSSDSITISRNLAYGNATVFENEGLYPPDIESMGDSLAMQIQQLNTRISALEA